ncbi:hypothetical protein AB3N02_28595 [Priestia aryabhattai]|uniref:hypothetical protein n=1 Tax=Priestia aryabhattai TaxID=412384 RepID=UPI0039A23209
MGGLLACSVTATVTIAGVTIGPITVVVPETGTGLVDVTIPLGGTAGSLVLVGIPCPTIEDITIALPGVSVVISVTEVPAP